MKPVMSAIHRARDGHAGGCARTAAHPAHLIQALLLGCLLQTPALAEDARPRLNIFPTQVVDNIRETGEAAKQLEDNLQGVIATLEQQQSLYRESKCEGAPDDQGCTQIAQQMASSYREMLDIMAEQLPEMERRTRVTRDALQQRLATEVGRNRTGKELQSLLRNDGRSAAAAQRTRSREGNRLSDRFQQYFSLVNQGSEGSLTLLGAQIYLDLEETSDLIALTRQQINQSRLMVNLTESFGTITPAMENTVSEVKRVVFGEGTAAAGEPMPAAEDPGAAGFCSEFDPNC